MKTVITNSREVEAARLGRAIHKWANDITPGASEIVLTTSTLVYNLTAGCQVLITQMDFDIATKDDSCHFDLVSCTAINGGGTATAISGHIHGFTIAGKAGMPSKEKPFDPPILVKYSDGVRSISIRVDANDAAAEILCGWHGWYESEEG